MGRAAYCPPVPQVQPPSALPRAVREPVLRTALVAAAVLTSAACAGPAADPAPDVPAAPPGRAAPSPARGSATARPSPPARVVVPVSPCPTRLGGTVTLGDPAGAQVRITLGRPSFSRSSLSPDYGKAPRNGSYLTVPVRVASVGALPALVRPEDFTVRQPGRPRTTTEDGNAPYSGAPQALNPTVVDPGETVTGPLTYDLASRSGEVVYAPQSGPGCSWRF